MLGEQRVLQRIGVLIAVAGALVLAPALSGPVDAAETQVTHVVGWHGLRAKPGKKVTLRLSHPEAQRIKAASQAEVLKLLKGLNSAPVSAPVVATTVFRMRDAIARQDRGRGVDVSFDYYPGMIQGRYGQIEPR